MSAESRSGRPKARRAPRSVLGNIAFGVGLIVVLTAMVLGAFAAVALLSKAADAAPLSTVIPDDGRAALVVGGIASGGVTGLTLPVILLTLVRGSEDPPWVWPGTALLKVLAVLAFDVYVLILAVILAQLGWVLPETVTAAVAVFAIGFSWVPLAMIPRERFGPASRQSD
ncbi:hypothetical protein ACIQI8_16690 [Streptomyces sp. NPDC092369]|uniref:hypothetical protein n=1 Tax=Streptomyces sp. NPDC092369 TaxID=3366015 RepID=UPI00382E9DB5